MLWVTASLLFLADKTTENTQEVGLKQAFALGISRSGATISTCVILKIDKAKAAQFSFLMVMPLIMGKVAKDLIDGKFALSSETLAPMGIGFVAAFVVELFACQTMINWVKNKKLVYFSIYCFIVGTIAIAYSFL